MNAGHTAGPYEVREYDNDKIVPTYTVLGRTKRGTPVYFAKADSREDAEFIAQACGAHDTMLAFIRDRRAVFAAVSPAAAEWATQFEAGAAAILARVDGGAPAGEITAAKGNSKGKHHE